MAVKVYIYVLVLSEIVDIIIAFVGFKTFEQNDHLNNLLMCASKHDVVISIASSNCNRYIHWCIVILFFFLTPEFTVALEWTTFIIQQ